jgi:ribonuclease D
MVAIASTAFEANQQCNKIRANLQNPVLGFDCEWNTSYQRHRVALVQLCTSSGMTVLFRLNMIGQMPDQLKKLLEDRNILKVGVGSTIDGQYLAQDYNLNPRGIVDIRHLTSKLTGSRNGGLDSLAERFLGCGYSHDQGRSDWEAYNLTTSQVEYAAMVIL